MTTDINYLKSELRNLETELRYNRLCRMILIITIFVVIGVMLFVSFPFPPKNYIPFCFLSMPLASSLLELLSVVRHEKSLFNMQEFLQSSLYTLELQAIKNKPVILTNVNKKNDK